MLLQLFSKEVSIFKKYLKLLFALTCLFLIATSHHITSANTTVPEYVFGADGRVIITDTRTLFYPSIVLIYVNDNPMGTGSMIARDVVSTSAHVIEEASSADKIKVVPGEMNGTKPYGEAVGATMILSPNYKGKYTEYDYAVIKLSSPLGDRTGYLKLSTNVGVGSFAQSAGYPEDRGGMVYTSGNIQKKDSVLWYKFDTYSGQSGSPILNSDGKIVGVHSGVRSENNPRFNVAPIVSQEMVDFINSIGPSGGRISIDNTHIHGQSVYRLYHSGTKKHHFTSNKAERDHLVRVGWRDEGVAWKTGGRMPVYRLYHAPTNDHLLTTSMAEVQQLQVNGWRNEGVAFQSGVGAAVHRLYHSGTLKHFYTKDEQEKNHLVSVGWRYEGIAFKSE